MDSRLVPWLPQVVYLGHYGSIFRNPLSNLRPVVFMGGKHWRRSQKWSVLNQPFIKQTLLIMSKSWGEWGHTSNNPPRQADSMIHTDNVSSETSVAYVQPAQEPSMVGDDILLRKHLLSPPELHLVCPPIRGTPRNCSHNINSMKSLKHPEIRLSACCERMKQLMMVGGWYCFLWMNALAALAYECG